jgi:hypothetical protein
VGIQPVNQLPPCPSVLGFTEEATGSALPKQGAEARMSSLKVTEGRGSQVNQQSEMQSLVIPSLLDDGKENCCPLRDVKFSLLVRTEG